VPGADVEVGGELVVDEEETGLEVVDEEDEEGGAGVEDEEEVGGTEPLPMAVVMGAFYHGARR
jgi:hypothetical protein